MRVLPEEVFRYRYARSHPEVPEETKINKMKCPNCQHKLREDRAADERPGSRYSCDYCLFEWVLSPFGDLWQCERMNVPTGTMILRGEQNGKTVSYQIMPLSFFKRNGRIYFDLEHCSERAAVFMVAKDPEHWRIIAGKTSLQHE